MMQHVSNERDFRKMLTRAVRLYGVRDLRLENFELPQPGDGEILARIVSDSVCMSTYKMAEQGAKHRRVPKDVSAHPVIAGHECCGEILCVGRKWQGSFKAGDRFALQPVVNAGTFATIGYSFPTAGGDATVILLPEEVMKAGCLLPYRGDAFFKGSLAEPMSCIVGAFHAVYHCGAGCRHEMGIRKGGRMAILAGTGPMGLGTIDYALHGPRRPKLLTVTDIDPVRLARAEKIFPPEEAAKDGIELHFVDGRKPDIVEELLGFSGGQGYDDVSCLAPVSSVVEQADRILARDGCLNFFAGPVDTEFSARFNFYRVHYNGTHVVGTSGGSVDDMREALELMADGMIHPEVMITHIGGLNAAIPTTLHLPSIPGGKKLIYTHLEMNLTAIDDFAALGEKSPLFRRLAESCGRSRGLWNAEAEKILLENSDCSKKGKEFSK